MAIWLSPKILCWPESVKYSNDAGTRSRASKRAQNARVGSKSWLPEGIRDRARCLFPNTIMVGGLLCRFYTRLTALRSLVHLFPCGRTGKPVRVVPLPSIAHDHAVPARPCLWIPPPPTETFAHDVCKSTGDGILKHPHLDGPVVQLWPRFIGVWYGTHRRHLHNPVRGLCRCCSGNTFLRALMWPVAVLYPGYPRLSGPACSPDSRISFACVHVRPGWPNSRGAASPPARRLPHGLTFPLPPQFGSGHDPCPFYEVRGHTAR